MLLVRGQLRLCVSFALMCIYINPARGHSPPSHPESCQNCPRFINTTSSVRTSIGTSANLTCGVRNLGDSQVSWIRRKDLHVLTTDTMTYTSDVRFRAVHAPWSPFWMLEIDNPQPRDEGIYECQVASQPKIYRRFHLEVTEPFARIAGSSEVYMKMGSDINITCIVTGHTPPVNIFWFHATADGNGEVSRTEINTSERGGVQLVTDRKQGTSWLLVDRATKGDAGNYSCAPEHTVPALVTVHVIQAEEAPAAMTPELTNSGSSLWQDSSWLLQPYPRSSCSFLPPTKCIAPGTRRREAHVPVNYNSSVSKFWSCSEAKQFWESDSSSGRISDFVRRLFRFLFSTAMALPFEMWAIVAVGSTANIVMERNMERQPVAFVHAKLQQRTSRHHDYCLRSFSCRSESAIRKRRIHEKHFLHIFLIFVPFIFGSENSFLRFVFLPLTKSFWASVHMTSKIKCLKMS